ncbi:Fanconi anemia core complex-associated protein 24-like [Lingula anatina]|uniref:Fanconi anemia core complex-associated protein 24-like n=1 Tax=Lingula anatina TaxID=7574 RepID=A0A1S3HK81_LINAN|nr:Fanconi anemia core complex-associated protein 24-like [Lingula anatina]|eukprot:XP_013385866.1 Fanconi anemia core complex-associated protein 24-like [Lingula anatina]
MTFYSSGLRGTVLAEKTSLSSQYFPALQKFAVLEIGLILFPVANQRAAGQLLWQMVVAEGKKSSNPFLSKALTSPLDSSVLNTAQLIPGLGDIKAKALLERFKLQ